MFEYPLKIRNGIIPNYFMNSDGDVWSSSSNKILKPFQNKEGKPMIALTINGFKKAFRLDYLVISSLSTFFDDVIRVVHIDGNDLNCHPSNLLAVRKTDIIDKYKNMYNVEDLSEISEEWKIYKEISSIKISNFGRILKINNNEFVQPYESHGYSMIRANGKLHAIHRLVAELFVENPRPDEFFYVNHLDGDKSNNVFYNLEWCNISMNADHAYLTGLSNRYSEQTIRNVCELLSAGISQTDISIITGVNRKFISDIYRGRRHKSISGDYEFKRHVPLAELYNKDAIMALTKSGYKPKDIASMLKLPYSQSFVSYYERLKRDSK